MNMVVGAEVTVGFICSLRTYLWVPLGARCNAECWRSVNKISIFPEPRSGEWGVEGFVPGWVGEGKDLNMKTERGAVAHGKDGGVGGLLVSVPASLMQWEPLKGFKF